MFRVRCLGGSRGMLALLLGLLWAALCGFGAPGASSTTRDDDRLTQSELSVLDASSAPPISARSAIVLDSANGRTLLSSQPDRRLAMASTTKMMTALVVTDHARPDETATVWPRDLVGGSSIYLRSGEQMTVEQLLYGALVPSGNDAAYTLADHIGRTYLGGVGDGGVAAFVQAMNDKARSMGLRNSHFVNPNGFDAAGQYSSARDLSVLARAVLARPLLASIVATAQYKAVGYTGQGARREPLYHPLTTTNELLGSYPGANGVKTGTTPKAGEVLAASVQRGQAGSIVVLMGSPDRFSEARSLFDWVFSTYRWVPLSDPALAAANSAARSTASAAVQSWNTDAVFYQPTPGGPSFWAGTEPLDNQPTGSP